MEVATAKVPFSMILLMDHIRTKRSLPDEHRCRMVVPSDGLVSVSLWDTADPNALKEWLEENLGSDCISHVCEVQEEFTYGVSLELARARGADRVAGSSKKTLDALTAGINTAQNRIQEWDRQTGVITQARETTASTVAKISGAVSKAAESERVQSVVAGASVAVASGWSKMRDSLGWAGRKLEAAAKEQGLISTRHEGVAGDGGLYQVPGDQLHHFSSGGVNTGMRYPHHQGDDLDRLSPTEFDGLDAPLGLGHGVAAPAVAPPLVGQDFLGSPTNTGTRTSQP